MAIKFTVVEHINLPKERVYEALTDLDGARQWMQGFVGIEKIRGYRIENGAVWREKRKMFGKVAEEEFEVVNARPNDEIRLRVDGTKGTSKSGEYLFQYLLNEHDGGTNVTLNGQIQGLKGVAALFGKMFAGFFRKACLKDLRSLKAHLEQQKSS